MAGTAPSPAQPQAAPAAVTQAPAAPTDGMDFDADATGSNSDKPFDDTPFDAGVQADEETDPKKYIEQLTGKLGQSLRKYTESQGQPDFELEKFAINSVLSASHTSEMDGADQKDIINKVKSSGEGDSEGSGEESTDEPINAPEEEPTEETPEIGMEEGALDEMSLNDYMAKKLIKLYDDGGPNLKKVINQLVTNNQLSDRNRFINDLYEDIDKEELDYIFDKLKQVGVKIPDDEPIFESIFLNEPKKNNMFQPGSNDILDEINDIKNLNSSEKNSIFVDKDIIKAKLAESFNQEDMTEPVTKPMPITKPSVKPDDKPIKPSRRNKPFQPNVVPDVRPDPKASN